MPGEFDEVNSWGPREQLERGIRAMVIGQEIRVSFDMIERAYPPVGMARGGMLEIFKAMSLSAGGNRPEQNMTSRDRFMTFLAQNGFGQYEIPHDRVAVVTRKTEECKPCHGLGQRQVFEDAPSKEVLLSAPMGEFNQGATVSFKIATCQACAGRGYVAATGDPNARFGDHSASDAWIERKRQERHQP